MCREIRIVMRAVLVVSIVCVVSFAAAQTADGQTPANEGVCDDLRYATPGLYGLCVAFCEAQDCEPDMNAADPFELCRPSSPKLLEIYNKRKRPDDPDMPCIQEPCPCWSAEELAGLRYTGDSYSCAKEIDVFAMLDLSYWNISNESYTVSATVQVYVDNYGPDSGALKCHLYDECENDDCLHAYRYFVLTPEEYAVCEAQVWTSGIDRGFDCYD